MQLTQPTVARCAILVATFGLLTWLLGAELESQPSPPATWAELHSRIQGFLAQPRFSLATWGIRIDSLDTGRTLFATNASRLLQPASNAKLFTGALALDRLGPDFRLRTTLLGIQAPDSRGTLRGDLVVRGSGDFSLAARFHQGDYSRSLDPLVEAVRKAGIRRIRGRLLGDARALRGPPWGTGWTWDDLHNYYGAEVSALNVEDNALDLLIQPGPKVDSLCRIVPQPRTDYLQFDNRSRTVPAGERRSIQIYRRPGSRQVLVTGQLPMGTSNWVDAVSVPQPALWLLDLLQERLQREGIAVRGKPQTLEWPQEDRPPATPLHELGAMQSPPVRDLVARMMKPSQNQYAHLLLLIVGAQAHAGPEPTGDTFTLDRALDELRRFVARLSLDPAQVRLDEGSGLSRTARVTPDAIVGLLKAMDQHSQAAAFRDALPVAGVDGTLARRLKGTQAEGKLRAKTGTLSGVYCLSGYVPTASGEQLTFAFMVNQHPGGSGAGRDDLDTLAAWLAGISERSNATP